MSRAVSARLGVLAGQDRGSAVLAERVLEIAERYLPLAYSGGEFAFTLRGVPGPDGGWQVHPAGTSVRYGGMVALGLLRFAEAEQRALLTGETCQDLIGHLAKSLDGMASLGDVAVLCWAAAEAGHSELPRAVARLDELDRADDPVDVVAAAWVVSALVAARPHLDAERHLAAARARLLAARGRVAYPHTIGGNARRYRAHVGSFADQVYPVQALARLHGSADDPEALAVAGAVAEVICAAQGPAGQWWWHYDSRTGGVVEGYPVYSVHQHSMAPMALLDLADAGGPAHLDAICRGLAWLESRPETSADLVIEDPPVIWRKVARGDPRKLVRGLRAAATSVRPGTPIALLDRIYPARQIDHECRPYEFGWLIFTWLLWPPERNGTRHDRPDTARPAGSASRCAHHGTGRPAVHRRGGPGQPPVHRGDQRR